MKVLVIGGDAAGMSAASQIKRMLKDAVEVTVLEQQQWTSYSACGIPFWVAGDVPDGPQRLVARSPAEHRANGLDVRTGVRAVAIDPAGHTVRAESVADGTDAGTFDYDHLIIATGAEPMAPPIPGLALPGVYRAQTLDDGQAAIDALQHRSPTRAVVLGAGYIGLEMAEAAVTRGLATTIVDLTEQPMATLDPDMGALVAQALADGGVDFRGAEPATELIAGSDGRIAAVRTGADEYPADIVFLGLGVRPRTELAAAAGLPLGDSGGLLVDDRCQVLGHPGIWAGGDCIEVMDRTLGSRRHVPMGTHANRHGRVIGLNIAGAEAVFPGVVGTAITRFRETEIARVGLRQAEAADAGMDPVAATIQANTRSGYMPGTSPMTVKMIASRADGRVVGCQIVGGPGAGKRIDLAAVAIWNGMTAAAMIDLDTAYAPPFSPVWDPVVTAARQVAGKLTR